MTTLRIRPDPPMADCRLSVVIPVLNESATLNSLLTSLQSLRDIGELIVVDGGSTDGCQAAIEPQIDQLLESPPGRALQLNTGLSSARGRLIWFVHADSSVGPRVISAVRELAERSTPQWGRFDVRLSGRRWMYGVIGRLINWRSRLSGIATGDQGIFVSRSLLDQIGGVPQQALMEDVELSKRLKTIAAPVCRPEPLLTSSRRWEQRGVWRTIWLMWSLRWAYFRGADPNALAARYR